VKSGSCAPDSITRCQPDTRPRSTRDPLTWSGPPGWAGPGEHSPHCSLAPRGSIRRRPHKRDGGHRPPPGRSSTQSEPHYGASRGNFRESIHDTHQVPGPLQRRALLAGTVAASDHTLKPLVGEGLVAGQPQRWPDVVEELPQNVASGPRLRRERVEQAAVETVAAGLPRRQAHERTNPYMTDFATAVGTPDPATAETLKETAADIRGAAASIRSARRIAEAWAARNEDAAEIASALTHVEQLPVLDLDQLAAQLADLGQAVLVRAEDRGRDMPSMGDSDCWSLEWRSGTSDAAGSCEGTPPSSFRPGGAHRVPVRCACQ
jgi:hypothetical protein